MNEGLDCKTFFRRYMLKLQKNQRRLFKHMIVGAICICGKRDFPRIDDGLQVEVRAFMVFRLKAFKTRSLLSSHFLFPLMLSSSNPETCDHRWRLFTRIPAYIEGSSSLQPAASFLCDETVQSACAALRSLSIKHSIVSATWNPLYFRQCTLCPGSRTTVNGQLNSRFLPTS